MNKAAVIGFYTFVGVLDLCLGVGTDNAYCFVAGCVLLAIAGWEISEFLKGEE